MKGRRPKQPLGSLLIITLWLVTILAALAIAIARYLSLELRLTHYRLAHEQAKALARSGVYLVMERFRQDAHGELDGKVYDWLGDDWALPWADLEAADGRISIASVTDEERKLNVNIATQPQLEQLIGNPELARALIEYLDIDQEGEVPIADPPYYQKNGPIRVIEELRDLPGMQDDLFEDLQQHVSPYTEQRLPPAINVNTVEPAVLFAIGGLMLGDQPTEGVINQLMAARPGVDGVWGTPDDCRATDPSHAADELATCAQMDVQPLIELFSKATVTVTSSIFRIQVEARVGPRHVKHRIDAVIHRAEDRLQILSWRER